MVEFTQREKIIVHSMNVMLNPSLKDVPFNLKTQALQATLLCAGYTWNESEMIDIMDAIAEETKGGFANALKLLDRFKPQLDRLNKIGS